jgi:hypothetical protein
MALRTALETTLQHAVIVSHIAYATPEPSQGRALLSAIDCSTGCN